MSSLSAPEALDALAAGAAALDVRSEGEFAQGAIPGFSNAPILRDEERHQVGLCYKTSGQAAAVELGHRLVDPSRGERVEDWKRKLAPSNVKLVTCWRGGLRSQLSCQWLKEAGTDSTRVAGGYKALRRELMRALENLPRMVVLAGATGSGKTSLLAGLPHLNLEDLAAHRGSAFGGLLHREQPTQASFENALAWELRQFRGSTLIVEDESRLIGRLVLPEAVMAAISSAPVVCIERSAEERATDLVEEYVTSALKTVARQDLQTHYESRLALLLPRLGGTTHAQVLGEMRAAFVGSGSHHAWIHSLLVHYYDKRYEFGYSRLKRHELFKGDASACRHYLNSQFA
jgi:tRNA 2-selenouridine synthase